MRIPMSRDQAVSVCKDYGAKLAQPISPEEQLFLFGDYNNKIA